MKNAKGTIGALMIFFMGTTMGLAQTNIFPKDGNVGIGTTTPQKKLHIFTQPSDRQIRLGDSNGSWDLWAGGNFHVRQIKPDKLIPADPTDPKSHPGSIPVFYDWLFISGDDGNVGIGTTSPQKKLHIFTQPSDRQIRLGDSNGSWDLWAGGNFHVSEDGGASRLVISGDSGNVGIGTTNPGKKLHILTQPSDRQIRLGDGNGFWEFWAGSNFHVIEDGGVNRLVISGGSGNVGIGTASPVTKLDIGGTTRTQILQITGGADLAEPFEFAAAEAIEPGMVVSIDPNRPGQLRLTKQAYDHTVAGVVSGADGFSPGITMGHGGGADAGLLPVALSGRVYALADATNGPIAPGDLLTTSDTPGHAMKVSDHPKAQGAIIGKAMSSLEKGRGTILVLVSLQ